MTNISHNRFLMQFLSDFKCLKMVHILTMWLRNCFEELFVWENQYWSCFGGYTSPLMLRITCCYVPHVLVRNHPEDPYYSNWNFLPHQNRHHLLEMCIQYTFFQFLVCLVIEFERCKFDIVHVCSYQFCNNYNYTIKSFNLWYVSWKYRFLLKIMKIDFLDEEFFRMSSYHFCNNYH